jgi:ketosteroid isomerase-like protein
MPSSQYNGQITEGEPVRKLGTLLAILGILTPVATLADSKQEVAETLDTFHRAAAEADLDSYLNTITDDVVFLGTDGNERWQGDTFRDFARENFSAGRGWVYKPRERSIQMARTGATAWFDESLENSSLGRCRGTGVVVKTGDGWRIAQYNLSVPVPNAMVEQVVADIAALESAGGQDAVSSSAATESAGAGNPSLQQVSEPPPSADCRRKRHKTNRKAGC